MEWIIADFDRFAIFGLEGIRFVGYFLLKEFFLLERRTLCLAFFNHKGREGGRKGHEDASLFLLGHGPACRQAGWADGTGFDGFCFYGLGYLH